MVAFRLPDYLPQPCSTQDLESPSAARVCLALDTIIQYSLEDIIPAVQTRLYDTLSHNSSVYVACSNKTYPIHTWVIKASRSPKDPSCTPGPVKETAKPHRANGCEGSKTTQRPRLRSCKRRSSTDSRPRQSRYSDHLMGPRGLKFSRYPSSLKVTLEAGQQHCCYSVGRIARSRPNYLYSPIRLVF